MMVTNDCRLAKPAASPFIQKVTICLFTIMLLSGYAFEKKSVGAKIPLEGTGVSLDAPTACKQP